MDFSESSIPIATASYTASLAVVGSLLQPTQEMVSEISAALAKSEIPPHTPYIAPDYTAHPWHPRKAMRTNALANWRSHVSRVRGQLEISRQRRLRRYLRFISTADRCRAWGFRRNYRRYRLATACLRKELQLRNSPAPGTSAMIARFGTPGFRSISGTTFPKSWRISATCYHARSSRVKRETDR